MSVWSEKMTLKKEIIKIIKEDESELKELIKRSKETTITKKIILLYIIKTEENKTMEKIAKELFILSKTLRAWLYLYKEGGLELLLEKPNRAHKKGQIEGENLEKLKERLNDEQGFNSYIEIQMWLKENCNLDLKYSVVYKTVRYKLKAKLKVARPVNIKKDTEKEEDFKKKCLN